ncbi:MAG: amidohydrolase family protein, partial [Candidatus Lustribacter sp.]
TTQIGDRPLTDPAFAEIFAELDRREQVVFLHPPGLGCASPIMRDGLSWAIGAPIEDAACAMQLMRADWPRRYPRLKVILPHLGGFIAFLRYRLGRSADPNIPSPVEQMRKFWYDTANGEPAALRASIECYGLDRLVFGTDYPYWLPGTGYEQAVGYISHVGLTPDEVNAIRFGNAQAMFGKALVGR